MGSGIWWQQAVAAEKVENGEAFFQKEGRNGHYDHAAFSGLDGGGF